VAKLSQNMAKLEEFTLILKKNKQNFCGEKKPLSAALFQKPFLCNVNGLSVG
jgi:hypothetical protein